MLELLMALYSEGNSDNLFLPSVIRRTSRRILAQHKQSKVNVVPVSPIKLKERKPTREESILQAAKQTANYTEATFPVAAACATFFAGGGTLFLSRPVMKRKKENIRSISMM